MQESESTFEGLVDYAHNLLEHKNSFEAIEQQLAMKTTDTELIQKVIKKIKSIRHEERRRSGIKKLGLGSLLLVVGFLITCINFHSNQSFTHIMYGFTTVGLIFMCWGLYEIIG